MYTTIFMVITRLLTYVYNYTHGHNALTVKQIQLKLSKLTDKDNHLLHVRVVDGTLMFQPSSVTTVMLQYWTTMSVIQQWHVAKTR